MTYSLLGQDLHETADKAKQWFAERYGANRFKCETEVAPNLSLRPTWQADLKTGYKLCVNVQPTPFSQTLHEFVTQAASQTLPIKLWVAVPFDAPKESFTSELKQARSLGVGVVQISDKGAPHEFHRSVPLSLFALNRTDAKVIPRTRREVVMNAEDTFLDGTPDQGCQAICQELESSTRQFAQFTYEQGYWKTPNNAPSLKTKFFAKDPWAKMLEVMESRIDLKATASKSALFKKQLIVRARSFTEWRNDVSHKPKTLKELQARDAKLRTMFEVVRNLLVEWYDAVKPFGLLK